MDDDKNSQKSENEKSDENQPDSTKASEPKKPSATQEPDLTEPELPAPAEKPELPAEEPKEELPAPQTPNTADSATQNASPLEQSEKQSAAQQDSPTDRPTESSDMSKNDAKGAKWYVVHTYSGHEAKVAATLKQKVDSLKLEDKVLDILVPTQDKIEIKEGKKTTVKEKIFPGYLLIRMLLDDDTWLAVRTTPGITSFVGISNQPTPLPDEEVASIQRFMHMEAPKFKTAFAISEAVKITDGPFSEFLGTISEIDEEKGKIKVLVSIFGRETPVELDFLQVAKL